MMRRPYHEVIRDQLFFFVLTHNRDFFAGNEQEVGSRYICRFEIVAFQVSFTAFLVVVISSFSPEICRGEDIKAYFFQSQLPRSLFTVVTRKRSLGSDMHMGT